MELLGFLWQAATAESAATTSAKQMATIFAPVLCKPTQAMFNPSQESEVGVSCPSPIHATYHAMRFKRLRA